MLSPPTATRCPGWQLAPLLLASSCMTAQIWYDDRSRENTDLAPGGVQTLVHTTPDGFVMQLPEDVGKRLVELMPLNSTGRWLIVRPRRNISSVASALRASINNGDLGPALRITEEPNGPTTAAFHLALPRGDALANLPGVSMRPSLVDKIYAFDVPCDLRLVTERPAVGGPAAHPELRISLLHERLHEDGTPTWERVAKTPITLLLDLLVSPVEVWWYFAR